MLLHTGTYTDGKSGRVGVFNDTTGELRIWTYPADRGGVAGVIYHHVDKSWERLGEFNAPTDSVHDVQLAADVALASLTAA